MAAVVVAYVATAPVTRASANVAAPVTAATDPAPATSAPDPTTPPTPPPTPARDHDGWRRCRARPLRHHHPPPRLPRQPSAQADPVVAVVGDSLAFSAAEQLGPAFEAAGFTPRTDIAPGRQIPVVGLEGDVSSGLDAIRGLQAGAPPALWVVQLGTNDVFFEPRDGHRYVALISSVLDAIGPGVPVVWVEVWRSDQRDRIAAVRRRPAGHRGASPAAPRRGLGPGRHPRARPPTGRRAPQRARPGAVHTDDGRRRHGGVRGDRQRLGDPAALAEPVADAAHRRDQRGVLLAELGPETADVDVDRAGTAVVLVAPHP